MSTAPPKACARCGARLGEYLRPSLADPALLTCPTSCGDVLQSPWDPDGYVQALVGHGFKSRWRDWRALAHEADEEGTRRILKAYRLTPDGEPGPWSDAQIADFLAVTRDL